MNSILHEPFDIEQHQKHFINYLEVIILENGVVEYAVPSHKEKLIAIAMKKLNVSRKELDDLCPPHMYFDFLPWLLSISNSVAVWNEFFIGNPNDKQLNTLKLLQQEELYQGVVPQVIITKEIKENDK